jgi:hypothetical protein
VGRACSKNGGEEECILDIGGKARWKETTVKTKGWILEQQDEMVWMGFIWLRIGTSEGIL